MPSLPDQGSVLGLDVGFSRTRRSSAVCRLAWDGAAASWELARFRALPGERDATLDRVAGGEAPLAAALDGPLRAGLDVIGRYRPAERMLTRRLGARIGRPGSSGAPVGRALNGAANDCAGAVLRRCRPGPAVQSVCVHPRALAEAFPAAFMGVMLPVPERVPATRADRSDVFFRHLAGTLAALLADLLPGRRVPPPDAVTDHDERAALVCALAALCLAAGRFTAVGEARDGWIVLPPWPFVQPWARDALEANAREEAARGEAGGRLLRRPAAAT